MKTRYDEVDGDFNTMMLGEAIGNGSVDESLATVNLLTILEENLGTRILQRMKHDGDNKGEENK
jgi:hypothetical protein